MHICKTKEVGGLGLPCFQHYYWAANVRALMYWQIACFKKSNDTIPGWLTIERDIQESSLLPALLFAQNKSVGIFKKCNPVDINSLKIWYQFRKIFKLPQTCSLTPIACIMHFLPHSRIEPFYHGKKKDLYIDNVFASFAQLRQKFGLPSSHFFK